MPKADTNAKPQPNRLEEEGRVVKVKATTLVFEAALQFFSDGPPVVWARQNAAGQVEHVVLGGGLRPSDLGSGGPDVEAVVLHFDHLEEATLHAFQLGFGGRILPKVPSADFRKKILQVEEILPPPPPTAGKRWRPTFKS